jgi:hypothetical protein
MRIARTADPVAPLNRSTLIAAKDHDGSTWTLEAIRALGVRTDLPTLGKIFGISRARAYQMAHTGEWEQAGIRVVSLGSRYVVAVQSILDVLGLGDAGPGSETSQRVQPAARTRAG